MTEVDRAEALRFMLEEPAHPDTHPMTFDGMHKRVEELMERPVWTHEIAYPEYLYHEILTGQRPTFEGVLAKLPHDKPVVVLDVGDLHD